MSIALYTRKYSNHRYSTVYYTLFENILLREEIFLIYGFTQKKHIKYNLQKPVTILDPGYNKVPLDPRLSRNNYIKHTKENIHLYF